MEYLQQDLNRSLMRDGNAVAGLLNEIFSFEMTTSPTQCAHCGAEGEVGSLLAFLQGPGIVLRCPVCQNIIMRIVQTPDSCYLDLRGAIYLRLQKTPTILK